jgi:glycosyltransferase involved in cell wall biosynthesis
LERRRGIRRLKLDYLEVFIDINGQTWLTLLLLKGPKLVGVWDEAAIFKEELPWIQRKAISFCDSWLRRHATLCLTSTREHQRIWEETHSEPVSYMPHACYMASNLGGLSPYKEATAVYMGNFYPNWDLDLIFHAFLKLKEQGLMFPLFLMGDGPDVPNWQDFVLKNGLTNITFAGHVTGESLWQHLRHAHVLLFPIRPTLINKTRCPSKTLAYAQARRPVITCKVGEVGEMLGNKALYVEPSAESFAKCIRGAMENLFLSDIDYEIGSYTWENRARELISTLEG